MQIYGIPPQNSGYAFCFTRAIILHPTCRFAYDSAYRWIGNTIAFMKPSPGVARSVNLAYKGLVSHSHRSHQFGLGIILAANVMYVAGYKPFFIRYLSIYKHSI